MYLFEVSIHETEVQNFIKNVCNSLWICDRPMRHAFLQNLYRNTEKTCKDYIER